MIYIYPTFTSKRKDHLPVRTRAGNGNWRRKKHVQRRQKHECAVQWVYLVGLPSESILIKEDKVEEITSQTKMTCMRYHLWKWVKWQWQGRTKYIMLVLLRADCLRKNQTIWPHVIPWSLKECCLLKGQPCGKRPEILHESDSRAKKHASQYLLWSRKGDFNSHCRELDDPVGGMRVR